MNPQERKQKIESYGNACNLLNEALKELPREMWLYKPSPEAWSVHEIVVHIADSEANSYIRCRRFIAEPGKEVMAYDQEAWAKVLNYHAQDMDVALELFRLLRTSSYRLIKDLPENTWANNVYHPENGSMTMDDWLTIYEAHIPAHIRQMQENLVAWNKR